MVVPVLVLTLAAYILQDALRDPGKNTDFLILISAALFALGFVSTYWSIRRHLKVQRMKRHATGK